MNSSSALLPLFLACMAPLTLGAQQTSHPDDLPWADTICFAEGTPQSYVDFRNQALQRRIVTSATYRQAVPAYGELARDDPENRLLARQRRLRLSAEALRDAVDDGAVQRLRGEHGRKYEAAECRFAVGRSLRLGLHRIPDRVE